MQAALPVQVLSRGGWVKWVAPFGAGDPVSDCQSWSLTSKTCLLAMQSWEPSILDRACCNDSLMTSLSKQTGLATALLHHSPGSGSSQSPHPVMLHVAMAYHNAVLAKMVMLENAQAQHCCLTVQTALLQLRCSDCKQRLNCGLTR